MNLRAVASSAETASNFPLSLHPGEVVSDSRVRLSSNPMEGFGTKSPLKVGVVLVSLLIGVMEVECKNILSTEYLPLSPSISLRRRSRKVPSPFNFFPRPPVFLFLTPTVLLVGTWLSKSF